MFYIFWIVVNLTGIKTETVKIKANFSDALNQCAIQGSELSMNPDLKVTEPEIWIPVKRKKLPKWAWLNGKQESDYSVISSTNCPECCIRLADSWQLQAKPCSGKYGYICQFDDEGNCKEGTEKIRDIKLEKICYRFFSSEASSWFEAKHKCNQKGGMLATLEHGYRELIHNILKNLSEAIHYSSSWVGLRNVDWFWVNSENNDAVVYQAKWDRASAFSRPTPWDCAVLTKSQHWRQVPCSDQYKFYCKDKKEAIKPTQEDDLSPTTIETKIRNDVLVTDAYETLKGGIKTTLMYTGAGLIGLLIVMMIAVLVVRKKMRDREDRGHEERYLELSPRPSTGVDPTEDVPTETPPPVPGPTLPTEPPSPIPGQTEHLYEIPDPRRYENMPHYQNV